MRGRRTARGDALGDLVGEIKTLGRTLHLQRLKAMEATALLDKLVGAIDVSVLAFDGAHELRLANPGCDPPARRRRAHRDWPLGSAAGAR